MKKTEPVLPAVHAAAAPKARRAATPLEKLAAGSQRLAGQRKLGDAVNRSSRARLDNAHQELVLLHAAMAEQDEEEKS